MTTLPPAASDDAPLFVSDVELAKRLGVGEDVLRRAIQGFERQRGSDFPRRDRVFAGRRYWPAIRQWLDRRYGVNLSDRRVASPPTDPLEGENWPPHVVASFKARERASP